jgi:hypothetical protein
VHFIVVGRKSHFCAPISSKVKNRSLKKDDRLNQQFATITYEFGPTKRNDKQEDQGRTDAQNSLHSKVLLGRLLVKLGPDCVTINKKESVVLATESIVCCARRAMGKG